jgi:hypothetical protein
MNSQLSGGVVMLRTLAAKDHNLNITEFILSEESKNAMRQLDES